MMPTCICCNSNEVDGLGGISAVVIFAGRRLDKPLDGGELFRCRVCGIAFRFPQPAKSELDELYRQGISDNWQNFYTERPDWIIAGNWISENLIKNCSLLDIGCFDGGFLNFTETTGKRYGIEIHEQAADRARQSGIQLLGKDFDDLSDIKTHFDVVTAFDVIEHSQNPLVFLEQMAKVTKKGGSVIISSGNSQALSWRLLGSKYWYCSIGEHMVFINPRWCEWAGNQLGLEMKYMAKYSHIRCSLKRRMTDCAKNLFYKISPRGFAVLRKLGMGGDEFREHEELLCHPPSWMSAKDQLICIYKKND